MDKRKVFILKNELFYEYAVSVAMGFLLHPYMYGGVALQREPATLISLCFDWNVYPLQAVGFTHPHLTSFTIFRLLDSAKLQRCHLLNVSK